MIARRHERHIARTAVAAARSSAQLLPQFSLLPSVLMPGPLPMSSLQLPHLVELEDEDEARRTSGS